MHPKNLHQSRYDLASLVKGTPALREFITLNPLKQETIDFSDPKAVKVLNKAILKDVYGIEFWDIPDGFLCPPVPGRVDYLHYLNDLLEDKENCLGLDIGTGANCIYPLLGHAVYGWKFNASELNKKSFDCAREIIQKNSLSDSINLRPQPSPSHIFKGIILPNEKYDFTMRNPPFHSSEHDALRGSQRKRKNLGIRRPELNFGGQASELWCSGGEKTFILRMIEESILFRDNCKLFTTLVSKEENLPAILRALKNVGARSVKTVQMSQGQKISRFIAWSF